jgi:hypothetical protein
MGDLVIYGNRPFQKQPALIVEYLAFEIWKPADQCFNTLTNGVTLNFGYGFPIRFIL